MTLFALFLNMVPSWRQAVDQAAKEEREEKKKDGEEIEVIA